MGNSIWVKILLYLRLGLDLAIDFFFSLYWDKRRKVVPNLGRKHAVLAESAVTLARKIREGELKSEELVQMVVERIKEVNPVLNAVARDRYELALSEAKAVDVLIASGLSAEEFNKKPFLGVPFTTKECQATKGMPFTFGAECRRQEIASEDSVAVARLKEAGAIVIASTNIPELLVWQETRNPVYGMTNNPHHTGRTPGGSSGAEAALTAAYATPISLCSDIGGSIRMPAFYCGMFGHYPTPGVINTKGIILRNGEEKDSMLSLGFISKQVEDLAPLTKIIGGDKAGKLNLDRNVDIKDIKFYYVETSKDLMVSTIRADLRGAMKRVVTRISQASTNTANAPQAYYHKGFNHMYSLWRHATTKEPEDWPTFITNNQGAANGLVELAKKAVNMSSYYIFTIFRLIEVQYLPKVDEKWADELTKDMKADLISKLGDYGVLLLPSAPQVAPYHYSCLLRPYNFSYWGVVNMLKCPATQVPLGVNSEGLPLGIQVVAAPNNDGLCLSVAKYLEKEFGGSVTAGKIK